MHTWKIRDVDLWFKWKKIISKKKCSNYYRLCAVLKKSSRTTQGGKTKWLLKFYDALLICGPH